MESRPPNTGKLREKHFFQQKEKKEKGFSLRFFKDFFPDFFSGLGWTGWRALVKSHSPNIRKQRGFFFAYNQYF